MSEPPYRVTGYDKNGRYVQRDFTNRDRALREVNKLRDANMKLGKRGPGKPIVGGGGSAGEEEKGCAFTMCILFAAFVIGVVSVGWWVVS